MPEYHAVVVPQKKVKLVKSALESYGIFNKKIKISPYDKLVHGKDRCYVISTTLCVGSDAKIYDEDKSVRAGLLERISTTVSIDDITLVTSHTSEEDSTLDEVLRKNPLLDAVKKATQQVLPSLTGNELVQVLTNFPQSYCIYPPMLLLPRHVLKCDLWSRQLARAGDKAHVEFCAMVAAELGVTHVAVNAPVPLKNESTNVRDGAVAENIIRSPTHFQPIVGDFGPPLPPYPCHVPSRDDFAETTWVSTRQNDITQVWAPRYTMFSAGNVTEKRRILKLPSVVGVIADGAGGAGCTAVDLFAGIGYFAFSYVKAGMSKVLCWDLNPWSIEGLRRGAAQNQWKASSIASLSHPTPQPGNQSLEQLLSGGFLTDDTRLVLFNETNERAGERIRRMQAAGLPPVRHVNCGMLPDAFSATGSAVEAVDPELGGWIHFHQVVGEGEVAEQEIQQTLSILQRHALQLATRQNSKREMQMRLDHVERVKSVAPRKWHVVLDVWLRP